MDAYSHRLAIAQRFGKRIADRDAVFMGQAPLAGLPRTVTDGETRLLSGMNALMLLQVMKDQGWTDPRFFTLDQINRAGWSVAHDAKKIGLQYLVSTGPDSMPLEHPKALLVRVFNAGDIAGVPAPDQGCGVSVSDLADTLRQSGLNFADGKMRSAVFEMALSLDAVGEAPAKTAALRAAIAVTLIEAQCSNLGDDLACESFDGWTELIAANPMAMYAAVRDAEILASQIVRRVQAVAIERETSDALAVASRDTTATAPARPQGKEMNRKVSASPRTEAMFAERAAVLAVPFSDKDKASALGAVYYAPQSLWFVPPGVDVKPFQQWNPRNHAVGGVATDQVMIEEFTKAMESLGLDTTKEVKADGKWHNVPVNSKGSKKNLSGSYIFSLDGARDGGPIGTINNKYTGEQFTWRYEGTLLTPEQRARFRQEALLREALAARETELAQDAAAVTAQTVWDASGPADGHPYLQRKGINAAGFRVASGKLLLQFDEFKSDTGTSAIRARENYLIVPMSDEKGRLRAVQAISPDGRIKSFMRGAQKQGTMLVVGASSLSEIIEGDFNAVAYVEGAATGVSLHAASDMPIIVCFDAGNMESVVKLIAHTLPGKTKQVVAVDNDQFFAERAMGILSEKMGLSPHTPNGQAINVPSGLTSERVVTLGEAVADGEWHQTSRGSYCINLKREMEFGPVDSMAVEIVPNGARKTTMTFENRGLVAGRVAMKAIAEAGPQVSSNGVMAIPEFKSLVGRPTDWNDLYKAEGHDAIKSLLPAESMRQKAPAAPTLPVGTNRRLASLSR